MARVDWTQLRVTRETRARLSVFMARLQAAFDRAQVEGNGRSEVTITVDYAINELLRRDEAKRARVRKAKSKGKRAELPPAAPSPLL